MTLRVSKAMMLTALFALAACGGGGDGSGSTGGGGGGGGGGAGGGGPVLPTIDDSAGLSQSTRAANFQIGSGATIAQNVSITLDAGYLTAINGTVRIFGQNVTITNGAGTLNNLPGGQDVRVEIDPSSVGAFAVPVSVFSYGPNLENPSVAGGESSFVVGSETDAAYLAARPNGGSVNYAGDFVAQGVLTRGGNEELSEIEGDITVNVSFGTSDTATTVLTGSYDPATAGPRDVRFTLNGAPISGNGFSGTLTCTTGSCTDNSSIDATFYGPEAEEVGGVIAIDINRSGETFQGAGTFVIGQ